MFLTHNSVCKSGEYGLGNQMFQIASTIGIAETNRCEPTFGKWENNRHFEYIIPSITGGEPDVVVAERNFDYSPFIVSEKALGSVNMFGVSGYLQSHKYFEDSKDRINKLFTIKETLLNEIKDYFKTFGTATCSISVRRGDYVRLQHIHPLQSDDYWEKAQREIENKTHIDTYIVLSDDPEWCRQNTDLFKRTGKKVYIFQGRTQIDDFTVITLCNNNIITNSTFSWWGAWLNKNPDKVVVMPKIWFGPQGPSEANDLRVEGWINV